MRSSLKRLAPVAMVAATLFLGGSAQADEPAAAPQTVEMFQAMADGQIDVRFIAPNAQEANLMIENLTDQPLEIQLPRAFAGVPVLAQFGGGGLGGGGLGGGGGGQGVGGGGGGFGGGGGGFGGGAGFQVAPEAIGKVEVELVCLEQGKPEPTARMEYEIIPIEEFTTNTEVHELCAMLGNGEIDQVSAQAAAWHLTDEMSWQELAGLEKVHLRNGHIEYWFNPQVLQRAQAIVAEAATRAEENAPATPHVSPGEIEAAATAAE